jgi:EpsI family protein
LFRQYKSPSTPDGFYLLIIFSTNIRNGAHAPEVCIEADGQSIVESELVNYDIRGVGKVRMRELMAQENQTMNLHTYVFKSGDHYTPSYFRQQASIMMNGLLQRKTAGALVRFTIPADRHKEDAARERLRRAVEELMPQIEDSLP